MINLQGKQILLVSKHKKEQAIQPVFKKVFDTEIIVCENVDTDLFGTFSGEIKRAETAKITVAKKCWAGLKINPEFRFALASEGSFGSHPDSFYLPYNEEWLIFIDRETHTEVYAKSGTTKANFISETISDIEQLQNILSKMSDNYFVLKNEIDEKVLLKGSKNIIQISEVATQEFKHGKKILLETDLRAMNNPLRMENIAQAAQKLVENLQSKCPNCKSIGFSIEKAIKGLACESCKLPSPYPKYHVKVCNNCEHEEIVEPIHKLKSLEPQYCQICNP